MRKWWPFIAAWFVAALIGCGDDRSKSGKNTNLDMPTSEKRE
jgi:hypothetical protein